MLGGDFCQMGLDVIGKKKDLLIWLINQDGETEYEIKPYHKARTNRQNSYYWVLVSKVADKMRMSKIEVHNRMLRDYGQPYIADGEVVYAMFPDTEETEKKLLREEFYHVAPTTNVRTGNQHDYRAYRILRGSSSYNTAEMTVLLDGLIQEAKQLEIETLPPEELERMRKADYKSEKKRLEKRDSAGV